MIPSEYQAIVQKAVSDGESVLLIAPTGLGKTFAVTGDLAAGTRKITYAVPLRALGFDIRNAIAEYRSDLKPVVHHGGTQESMLFSEEVIITTYDQIVAGVPGLPLSLPLKAGHAVAGALLMSRLILDEAHLAWAISPHALPILMAVLASRSRLGLQSVVLTATLPDAVARLIAEELGLKLITVGDAESVDDKQLQLREANRHVRVAKFELPQKGRGESKQLDWSLLDSKLLEAEGKRIYFGNTVERLQSTYDRLIAAGADASRITVLHNRMPSVWRAEAEIQVQARFGKKSPPGDWLLLTNQVAEAGLDISAPLVITDPAPVDTLVQRAGRCARWFRDGVAEGDFLVLNPPKALIDDRERGLASPYQPTWVQNALDKLPTTELSWSAERQWVNEAWGRGPKDNDKKVQDRIGRALDEVAFALNLFDRAAQDRRPNKIANMFREILSVEVAVENSRSDRELQGLLDYRSRPDTSTVSLGRAWQLLREAQGTARAIRYDEEGDTKVEQVRYVQPGDVLIVPPSVAYLHRTKGLCFGAGTEVLPDPAVILRSEWKVPERASHTFRGGEGRRQFLLEHARGVMNGTYERLSRAGTYRNTLTRVLKAVEPSKDAGRVADAVALIATLAAGFHDLGKANRAWQQKARSLDPGFPEGLIGRTAVSGPPIGVPHTPPAYVATLVAAQLLMGVSESAKFLIRAIALAAARHHSSFLNPARVNFTFEPEEGAKGFVIEVLEQVGAPQLVLDQAQVILDAAKTRPNLDGVPLLLPNDDLFPIYALVGRAILMADREDASGEVLEVWRE